MDVELYVYDLSKGLARQWSLPLTGTHIDAIYHTAIVLNGVEYYFGHGIQTAYPGSTHHGQPMEKVHLGQTELPPDVISEYIESLGEIYTPESYDLFLHNCNNFTQDLAMFLLGKSIPDHIRNLPQTFLSTPFGQMIKPQIEAALRPVTQAPSTGVPTQTPTQAQAQVQSPNKVHHVTNLTQLNHELNQARHSAAIIFFTSATCPPCKALYPLYDELAEEAGSKATLIKVDISSAYDVAMKYGIKATPTFKTYLKGQETETWSGANASQLQGNIRLLIEMANPAHPHRKLNLPTFQRPIPASSFIHYKNIPPLDKLLQKLPRETQPNNTLTSITTFITNSIKSNDPRESPLPPDLPTYPTYIESLLKETPSDAHFAIIDLTRLLTLDPRVASYFFSSHTPPSTLLSLLLQKEEPPQESKSAYTKTLTTLHLLTNLLLTSPHLPTTTILSTPSLLTSTLSTLTSSLFHSSPKIRCAAASLAYNLTAQNHNSRIDGKGDLISEEDQVSLVAGLIEAIANEEESGEALRGFLMALGLVVYECAVGGEVEEVCRVLGAREVVLGKKGKGELLFGGGGEMVKLLEGLIGEVAGLVGFS
ncbi:PPPDE putative peptidase domain-containing protein [Aspergillus pseudotamarii]|uniref:PPPDE putative peptidase domain-containing protein n=1 Tax=Aspergillus pseudotamarii TaxID=132259 RepID=A0A5N6SZ12_ASPPS|nr:PPPDE putative peptidase domain-containing protein [Aspergillus pseudotamarii]KAE8139872.1 PPPDE putative peptidase domain-containing protein [Aspergillus pseudotamarii]